jgi:ribosomal protein S18 acetylase RimI-like enzyme
LDNGIFAGFCYIESWQDSNYVAHSGLIVHPDYRNLGLAKKIKSVLITLKKNIQMQVFELQLVLL